MVSTTQLNSYAAPTEAPRKPIQPDLPSCAAPECDTWTYRTADMDGEATPASIDPDVFSFNGEAVTLASDPGKPYAIYRRDYPHKPKWIVADASHRVIALLLWRTHAQAVADELNALAAK